MRCGGTHGYDNMAHPGACAWQLNNSTAGTFADSAARHSAGGVPGVSGRYQCPDENMLVVSWLPSHAHQPTHTDSSVPTPIPTCDPAPPPPGP